jgi:hypothetical protein
MTRQVLTSPMKLLLLVAGVMLIGYLVFNHFNNFRLNFNNQSAEIVSEAQTSTHTPQMSRATQNGQSAQLKATTEVINLSSAMNITYKPSTARWRRQVAGNMSDMAYDSNTSNFWLYAQSEKDARWLDQYGYPTPDEHARLTKAGDAELENLTQNGDLNAKIHLAARAAKKAYSTLDDNDAIEAHKALVETLRAGGPYQAVMVAKSFKEMTREFQRLPTAEQTQERRAVIQRFSDVQDEALIITSLYGDDLGRAAQAPMSSEAKSKFLGLKVKPDISGDAALSIVTGSMRWRDYNGLPPLVIVPRPREPETAEKVVIERY